MEAFIEGWRSESQSNPKLSLENGDSTKEELLKYKEQEVEKSLMIFTVAAFGRWFLFWCGNLSQSVFEEIAGDKSMEPIVEFSIKRAELLLRKIEGKEEIVVESIKELELEAPVAALGGALKIVAEVDEELDLQAESVEVSKLNGLGATIELNEEELEELDAPSEGVVHSKVDELAEVTVEEQNKVNEELVTD